MRYGVLKELRKSRGISQKKFAQDILVSQQTVASWETDRTEPSNENLKIIANYFGVTTDYLLGCDPNAAENPAPLSKDESQLLKMFQRLSAEGKRVILAATQQMMSEKVPMAVIGARRMKIRLKEIREARNVTQAELAKILQVTPAAVGLWEQGRRQPDYESLIRIADYFGVTTDYLLGRENQKPPEKIFIEKQLPHEESRLLDGFRRLNSTSRNALLTLINGLSLPVPVTRQPSLFPA